MIQKLNLGISVEVIICAVMTSLYASKEKADQAMAARKPLLEDVKAKIKSINTHEGEAHQLR